MVILGGNGDTWGCQGSINNLMTAKPGVIQAGSEVTERGR